MCAWFSLILIISPSNLLVLPPLTFSALQISSWITVGLGWGHRLLFLSNIVYFLKILSSRIRNCCSTTRFLNCWGFMTRLFLWNNGGAKMIVLMAKRQFLWMKNWMDGGISFRKHWKARGEIRQLLLSNRNHPAVSACYHEPEL